MRQARIKIDTEPCWYHCYNRVAGTKHDRPFGDVEKEQFVRILKRICKLYSIQVVSYQVLSNHFHLLAYAPEVEPDAEQMCRRYSHFHNGKRTLEPDSPACRAWQARSRDISWFMRHLQQLFTAWYNRTRPVRRRGSLWADRFKHTLLESGAAVWACWTYIENNAVRAHMVERAGDYRFGSHGAWLQAGRHPFAAHVKAVALPMLRDLFGLQDLPQIRAAMEKALAGKSARETPETGVATSIQRRVRYWTQGLVIGSRLFVTDVMRRHKPEDAVTRHRSARLEVPDGYKLYAWRRPRPAGTG